MALIKYRQRWFSSCARLRLLTPVAEYNRLVGLGRLKDDEYQKGIISNLSKLHKSLETYKPPKVTIPKFDLVATTPKHTKPGFFSSFFVGQEPPQDYSKIPKGIYLWGDVGCGKTMLMDIFYSTVPKHLSKQRIHFHQFMQNLHKRSHQLMVKHGKHDIDPIPILAAEIAKSATVLCFDEFQVTDIADAMMLRRLIQTTLSPSHGLILFATSNREPKDLYANGIQRESFIPAIKLLEQRTKVVHLDSPIDYRRVEKPISSVYYSPPKGKTYAESAGERQNHIHQWFTFFIQKDTHEVVKNDKIEVWGRNLMIPISIPNIIAQFTFEELCARPLSAGDYLALASHYKNFIITDIPYLTINVRDQIRRFITFLDAAYNNHCKLATTGADQFSHLFVEPKYLQDDYTLRKGPVPVDTFNDATPEDKQRNKELKHEIKKKLGDNIDQSLLDQGSRMFQVDEERFAFVRALSRLAQMSTTDWIKYTY